jgi:hypothetical protein
MAPERRVLVYTFGVPSRSPVYRPWRPSDDPDDPAHERKRMRRAVGDPPIVKVAPDGRVYATQRMRPPPALRPARPDAPLPPLPPNWVPRPRAPVTPPQPPAPVVQQPPEPAPTLRPVSCLGAPEWAGLQDAAEPAHSQHAWVFDVLAGP